MIYGRKWGIGLGIFVIACFIFLMAFFALSGCASSKGYDCGHSRHLEGLSYDMRDREWSIWLEGYSDYSEYDLARVRQGCVNVELRTDGKNCTTVKFHGDADSRFRYKRATILVPNKQKYEEWKERLGQH